MKRLTKILFAIAGAFLLEKQGDAQGVLYDNGSTPTQGQLNGGQSGQWWFYNQYPSQNVTDSFTLANSSTINGFSVGVEIPSGDTLETLTWQMTTSAFGGSVIGSGSTSPASSVSLFTGGYDGYIFTFTNFNSLMVGAGTYWLELDGQTTANNAPSQFVYWIDSGLHGGPSSAFADGTYRSGPTAVESESFQILGTITPTPEPSTLALAGLGATSLLAFRRK